MFDVYVEGATGTSPGAVRELANAMAARYGVPAAEIHARLTRGRFRVKADIDRATAATYQRDLESIGARVRIEPSTTRPARSSLPPQPETRPARSSLPPQPEARPARSSLPPQPEPRSRAAESVPPPIPTTLGALDRSGLLSLATLDDEPAPLSLSDGTMPASMGPAAPRPSPPPRSRSAPIDPFAPPLAAPPAALAAPPAPSAAPLAGSADRFAPPELASAEALVELADDELAYRARKRASTPPAVPQERASSRSIPSEDRRSSASVGVEPPAPAAAPAAPRARFAAGLVLAIVVGFIPAHFIAAWRERAAFSAIDDRVAAVQAAADTPERYAALDEFRAAQLDAKRSARRQIALLAVAIWAAAGGAVAYGWSRRWRPDPRPERHPG